MRVSSAAVMFCAAGLLASGQRPAKTAGPAAVSGQMRKWHTITLDFTGPVANEADSNPNPFLDYRLQVAFQGPNGREYNVPGFFDGDGKGDRRGSVWRVRFTTDQPGRWTYRTSFREGNQIAIEAAGAEGKPVYFDGARGSFVVQETGAADGFARWGRLEYNGTHYLKFRDGGYWIKGGTDEPEDFLGYRGFDDTPPVHDYAAHATDWRPGDPDWNNGAGKAIIGSLNYLSSQHVNSLYALLMNIGGDGKNVWPFVGPIDPNGSEANDNLHYDISKLAQWETVFAHAQKKGVFLHLILNEAEEKNKRELDDGKLGPERKLYYREMIARFGHHLALQWNICEEYDFQYKWSPKQIKEFAAYISAADPYAHPIAVHNNEHGALAAWLPFMGDKRFSATSLQYYPPQSPDRMTYAQKVEQFRRKSEEAGRPLVVFMDELFQAARSDDDRVHQQKWPFPSGHSYLRKHVVWPIYLSGGAGVEHILEGNLKNNDFRLYEPLWKYTWYARRFMEEQLPFWEMKAQHDLLTSGSKESEGYVFAKTGQVYAVYMLQADAGWEMDLSRAPGKFSARWYNPRRGDFQGSETVLAGGSKARLPPAPADVGEDWTLLLKRRR